MVQYSLLRFECWWCEIFRWCVIERNDVYIYMNTTERNKQTRISCTRSTRVHLRMLQTANCLCSIKSQWDLSLLNKRWKSERFHTYTHICTRYYVYMSEWSNATRRLGIFGMYLYECLHVLGSVPSLFNLLCVLACATAIAVASCHLFHLFRGIRRGEWEKTICCTMWVMWNLWALNWVGDCVKISHIICYYSQWPLFALNISVNHFAWKPIFETVYAYNLNYSSLFVDWLDFLISWHSSIVHCSFVRLFF